MWAQHRAGKVEWGFHLWVIYNVRAWYDYWIANRDPAPLVGGVPA